MKEAFDQQNTVVYSQDLASDWFSRNKTADSI